MTKQAWFCPACQRHHAPHCDTCPSPFDLAGSPLQTLPDWMNPIPFNPCAGCKGPCLNAACPRLPRITCATSNTYGSA